MSNRRLYNYPKPFVQVDFSGGVQNATSHLLRKRNEVVNSKNANYSKKIGSASRRDGYEKVARTIEQGNDSLWGGVFRYGTNNKVIVGINDPTNTSATLRVMDTGDYWTTILSGAAPNTRFQCLNYLNEYYVAGCSDNNTYLTLQNIDSTLIPSTTRNVYGAPKSKYIAEYNGQLYALNCQINGVTYPDRAYLSSAPLGFITLVQTDQIGLLQQLRVDSVRYIKVGMSLDVYAAGTDSKKATLTAISVDKKNNRFSFAPQAISFNDNDEIWPSGRKGKLSILWNTDYKTPETSDFLAVPPSKESNPEFTGWGKNNNRLFLFTKNSFLKWDGQNLITVSDTIGCVSHETIRNIGSWTLWLHNTGVWGYNDNTGALKLLSRSVQGYIDAINQPNLSKASAVVSGRTYKLAVGEILALDSSTTSTSTSSTSTSSTSSSTSSTSTSSTSTSSTSISTSQSTTSTSSTSSSTSSTSVSTTSSSTSSTSTSVSTSTSSTSTTTLSSTKQVIRLVYDFDMNNWAPEVHKREFRFQFLHTMGNYTKPYFTDETGRLFRDETGNLDNQDTIPFELEIGRDNFGEDQIKKYLSQLVDSEKARGAIVQYAKDGGKYTTLGQITDNIQRLEFPQGLQLVEARDISFKIVHNDAGDGPVINGLSTYYSLSEMFVTEAS